MTIWASVPRLFLRTCRWVLGRMPFNNHCNLLLSPFPPNMSTKLNKHKLQGVCSSSSSTDGSWRWWRWRRRRRRNLIILVVVAVLVCFLLGSLWGISYDHSRVSKRRVDKVAAADMWWDQKSRILQEQFNLSSSKDQLISMATLYFMTSHQKAYLACIDELGLGVPFNNGIQCALEQLSSDRQKFELWRNWLTENIEGRYQCPVRNNFIPETLETSSVKEEHAPTVQSQNTMVSSLNADQHSESLSVCFLKTCWCVIFFIVVSWKVSVLYEGIRINLKWEHVQNKKRHLQSFYKCGGKWRRKLLILFLLSGVIGSTWLFWFMNKNTILWRTEMLANMCDERARMLQDQFNVSMNHVHALAILVSTFHHGKHPSAIDQRTFAEYTEITAFERPLTSGVAYALKVVHSERAKFEKIHGWTIKKMVEADHSAIHDYIPEKLDPSPIQEEYAPVIFSQETVSHIVSIDMMSGKEDRENILRARASGKGVLTPPFKLLKSNHLGVVLTFAVYNTKLSADATPEQRIEATEGYLGASYDVPSLVEKLLHQLASKQTIVVNVFDITNISAPINMYGPNVTNTGPLHISDLHFGDPHRRHEMHCRFKQKPPPPWTAIMASTGILVITLLLGHIFHAAINRIAKVEGDYREMMELKIRAEAADVAKSQFLATVSHEIRTPMNGVLGMLQMLMDTELNANQFDYAQTAHSSGKDLISLINEVLDQAKIESGRLELEAVLFDPRSVLDNVLSLFSGKSHDKGIELAGYVSDSVPEAVIGDPGRFRQIITNLVGNSVKFTVEGHIFVSIYLAEEVRNPLEVKDEMCRHQLKLARNGVDRSYNTLSGLPVVDRWKSWQNFQTLSGGFITGACEIISLLVTVEDTGVGILRDAQSRIFMPFMQADSSTSRTYGGTGIGLSISKCLVDMMGGEIGFVSEPGMGSTFSFAVAFRKAETNSLKTKQHQFQSPVSEFCGMRALVVDGTSIRAEVTKYHLRRLEIYVDIVSSPKSLWSHVSNLRCSSGKLCVNMVLIEKDGWDQETTLSLPRVLNEFCQNVREVYSESCLKIFLLATSSSSELDRFKSSSCMDDVIMKPLRLSMLITCFQQILGAGAKKYQNKVKPPFLQSLLSGKHILVVDDNIVNRRVAEGALIKYGAKVTCVESGKAAIELLWPPHKFDACFMDLQMPEMDGFEATRQIRCIENELNNFIQLGEASNEIFGNVVHWHTPILAMTADVIQATHEKCITCGMDGYVSKPFEEQQLYTAVLQFFESGQ